MGLFMCKHFWPRPTTSLSQMDDSTALHGPRRSTPRHSLRRASRVLHGSLVGPDQPLNKDAFRSCLSWKAPARLFPASTSSKLVSHHDICNLSAWSHRSWKPIGGRKFTGYNSGLVGRKCPAILPPHAVASSCQRFLHGDAMCAEVAQVILC